MTPYERVEAMLKDGGYQQRGSRYFRCPSHEDRLPSLSLKEGLEGRVLLYCHAGCTVREIVAALDLTMEDLFPEGVGADPSPALAPSRNTPYVNDEGSVFWVDWERWHYPPDELPGFIVVDGQRVWTDWRAVEWEAYAPYRPGPMLLSVAAQYPRVDWLLAETKEDRAWLCRPPHLAWLEQVFPEVPSWAWNVLATAA